MQRRTMVVQDPQVCAYYCTGGVQQQQWSRETNRSGVERRDG